MSDTATTREQCEARDRGDPLARFRALFDLPADVIYLDGNSLGPPTFASRAAVQRGVADEWGRGLIRSWNDAGWIDLPRKVGARIAPLIGAAAGEVIAGDSTSVNLFKLLSAALQLQAGVGASGRSKIVSERSNFPTDLYIAEGLVHQLGGRHQLILVDEPSQIPAVLDETVAVLMLTHVNYRSGYMHDLAALTRAAHEVGALVVWDLAHSAGAVPLDLAAAHADFAVGCGYKFLNGGPGAPAYLYVAERHQAGFCQPLSGWFGHAQPFAFEPSYRPANDVARYLCGTPPVLSMLALDAALEPWAEIDMAELRRKSLSLTDLFIELVEQRCSAHPLTLVTPREHGVRGSQVSFAHEHAFPIMQALIARGVIGDFRAPDILRFGCTPLYLDHVDVWRAVDILADLLDTGAWHAAQFNVRHAVT